MILLRSARNFVLSLVLCAIMVATFPTRVKSDKNVASLSESESKTLSYIREKEKLARDLYLTLYGIYGTVILINSASVEQEHMDTIKRIIDGYALPDPALDETGWFNDLQLQEKYEELVHTSSVSYGDALVTITTMGEIDVVDLQYAIDITDNVDVVQAYEYLLDESKLQLKTYNSALLQQGFQYDSQYIDNKLFNAIIMGQ